MSGTKGKVKVAAKAKTVKSKSKTKVKKTEKELKILSLYPDLYQLISDCIPLFKWDIFYDCIANGSYVEGIVMKYISPEKDIIPILSLLNKYNLIFKNSEGDYIDLMFDLDEKKCDRNTLNTLKYYHNKHGIFSLEGVSHNPKLMRWYLGLEKEEQDSIKLTRGPLINNEDVTSSLNGIKDKKIRIEFVKVMKEYIQVITSINSIIDKKV